MVVGRVWTCTDILGLLKRHRARAAVFCTRRPRNLDNDYMNRAMMITIGRVKFFGNQVAVEPDLLAQKQVSTLPQWIDWRPFVTTTSDAGSTGRRCVPLAEHYPLDISDHSIAVRDTFTTELARMNM